MTAPSVTGSITQIQNSGVNGSQNISVPADATLCIVAAVFYEWQAMNFSSLTLGGDSLSAKATQNNDTGYGYSTIWTRVSPKTGTQSLAWSFANAPDEGANIFVIFLKDVDTSGDPIRSSGTGTHASSATSSSFASSTNDLCLCVGYSYSTTDCNAAPTNAGQTEIADSTAFNNCQGAVGTKAGVNGNTTMKVGGSYCTIAAVSIKGTIDPLVVNAGYVSAVGATRIDDVIQGTIVFYPGFAHVRGAGYIDDVIQGTIVFYPGFVHARGATRIDDVIQGTIVFYPHFAHVRGDVFGTVQIESGIPPLGEGDTAGFVLWMLAHSYYANLRARGLGDDLQEPTGDNAENWGGVFFLP